MSRIGNSPIAIPAGVTVDVDKNIVTVKGKLGELTQEIKGEVSVEIDGPEIKVTRANDEKQTRAYHGLYRSLINNMIIGVSEGYEIKQELVGVGYKAEVKGQILELALGFTHPVFMEIAPEIEVEAKTEKRGNPIVTFRSHDKQLVGQVAAKLRSLRKPEPYKGKGIKFVGEELRRKAGKTAG